MKKLILALAIVLTACGQKTDKAVSEADSLPTDSIADANIDKHSETYIRQRLDTIYSDIRQRVAGETDDSHPYMDSDFNPDSAYCSSRYYSLMRQAFDFADETGDVVFDADHWINGQDFSKDWNYQIHKVYDITDSTALADIIVIDFGNKNDLTLSLIFERDNWYIDDFGPEDSEGSDKAYFRSIISNGLMAREKAKALVGEWGWVGDDGPELMLNLKMTDNGLKAGQCDVYRMYGFDKTAVTFDGEQLSVTELEYDDKAMKTVREFSLYVHLDEQGDLTGTCHIVHPQASEAYDGPITLRKGYFKYRN